MARRALLFCGLMFALTACAPNVEAPKNATQEGASTQSEAGVANSSEAKALDPEVADSLIQSLKSRWDSLIQLGQEEGGIAVGIVVDGQVAFTHCMGVTNIGEEGKPITPKTMFNVRPSNPFKISNDFTMFTADGFKSAGVTDIAFSPEESFAHPFDMSDIDPNDEDKDEVTVMPFKVTETKDALWANLDGVMQYLIAHPSTDGMVKESLDNFSEEVLRSMMYGSGYTVSVTTVPSEKTYIVILENSVDLGVDSFESGLWLALMPDKYVSDDREIEEMNPSERRIYYAVNEKYGKDLVGQYKCEEGYRDFRIKWDGEYNVLETDHWRSRISAFDTYEAGSESVNENGELEIDGAVTTYKLMDAPAVRTVLIPEYDENKKILSIAVGEERDDYEKLEETIYHFRMVTPITTCRALR